MTHWKAINMAMEIQNTCKEYTDDCNRCPFNIDGCICSNDGDIPELWNVGEVYDRLIETIKRKKVEK